MNQDPVQPPPRREPPPEEPKSSFGTLLLKLIGTVFAFAFIAVGLLFGSCLLR